MQLSIQWAGSTNGRWEVPDVDRHVSPDHQEWCNGPTYIQYMHIRKENPPPQLKNALITTFIHFLAQLSRPGWAELNWRLSAMVIEGNLWLVLTRSCFTEGTGTTGKAWTVTGRFGGSSSEASLDEMEGRDCCHPRPPEPKQLGSQVETEEVHGSLRSPGGRNRRP